MRKVIIPDEPFIFLKSDSNFLENVLKAVDLLPKVWIKKRLAC